MRALIVASFAALALTACSKANDTATAAPPGSATAPATTKPAAPKTARQYATALKSKLPRVRRIIVLTEDTDPNNMLGRPNGYVSAAVLIDPQGESPCSGQNVGAECGAKVEVWPNVADAAARIKYVQQQLKQMPMLGTEYDYQAGPAVLRIHGTVKPSIARTYQRAWRAVVGR
jgi:hypothetical protein